MTPAVPFLNSDPIAYLVGWCNEAPIIVDRQKVTTLIDLTAQVSSVSSGFCKWTTLKVHPLDRLLELVSTGGSAIPYLGYAEVNLEIPGIRDYNKDILLLVILTTTYSEKALAMVGSKIINRAIVMITKGGTSRATMRQTHFGVVMFGSLQLPLKCAGGWGSAKGATSSTTPEPTVPKEFYLDDVQGHVCTTRRVTIPQFGTINFHSKTDVKGHCM